MNTTTPSEPKQTSVLAIYSTIRPSYSTKDLKIIAIKLFVEPPPNTLSRFSNSDILLKPSTT
jgi:hypothetical protein